MAKYLPSAINFLYHYSSFLKLIKSLKSFHLNFNHPQLMPLNIPYVGFLCLTLKWAALQPGLMNSCTCHLTYVQWLWDSSVNYLSSMPGDLVSLRISSFLWCIWGKWENFPYWNVSQSREMCALRAHGKLAGSVCKTFQGLKWIEGNWEPFYILNIKTYVHFLKVQKKLL